MADHIVYVIGKYVSKKSEIFNFKIFSESSQSGDGNVDGDKDYYDADNNVVYFVVINSQSSKTIKFQILREEIKDFISNVMNKGINWNLLEGSNLPGIWVGEVVNFFPSASPEESMKAGDSLILLGQQMARAKRNELNLTPRQLAAFHLFDQKQIPREALNLLLFKEFSKEDTLLGALKDEPINLNTKRTKLMFLAYKGNVPAMLEFIDKYKANVNAIDSDGKSALYYAAEQGNLEAVQLLLNRDAQVDGGIFPFPLKTIKVEGHFTPLFIASKKGYLEIVRELIAKNATINYIVDNYSRGDNSEEPFLGYTSLAIASYYGHIGVVHELLNRGAEINLSGEYGTIPLVAAILNNQIEIYRELIARGADIQLFGNISPLGAAVEKQNVEIVHDLLDRGADVDIGGRGRGETPFDLACNRDIANIEIVRMLLSKGATINRDKFGNLYQVSAVGNTEIVRELLSRGEYSQEVLLTALDVACRLGKVDVVIELLNFKGELVNVKREDSRTILHDSVMNLQLEVVKVLISRGADVNAALTFSGDTPLHKACFLGDIQIMSELLTHGANPNITNSNGDTPLMSAINRHRDVEIIRFLLRGPAIESINAKNKRGVTALIRAVEVLEPKEREFVQVLCEVSDVNIQDNQGNTALHYAIKLQKVDFVNELLIKGANFRIKNALGENANDLRKKMDISLGFNYSIYKLLWDRGER